MIRTISTVFCITLVCLGTAQNTLLDRKLDGISNHHEIMRIVDTHYDSLHQLGIVSLPGELKYKHWKRRAWYESLHLKPDGTVANIGKRVRSAIERLDAREEGLYRTTNSGWSFVGPSMSTTSSIPTADFPGLGRVDRIAFHPTDPDIIYIGTPSGGVWKTIDGGSTWAPKGDHLPAIGISGIVLHPVDPDVIFVLTGDGDSGLNNSAGIYQSVDGGESWNFLSDITPMPFLPFQLAINPGNPLLLFAATNLGIYRSTDGGLNWTQRRSGIFYDVALHPGDSSIIYGAGFAETVISTNNGATFFPSTYDILPLNGRKMLAVTPADPNLVYLMTGPVTGSGTFNGFYKSDSLGLNFVRQTNTPNLLGRTGSDNNDQSFYDLTVVASPTNPNLVLTGGLIIFRTMDGGVNFSAVTSFNNTGGSWYVHPDVHDLEYNPVDGSLYAATDGGFYKSTDDGDSWVDLSEGIETTMFYNMAGYPGDERYLLGGTQDNGVKYRKTNTSDFVHTDCCDGFEVTFDPNTHATMYSSLNQWLSKYTNNGTSKTDITPKSHWFMRVATHVTNSNLVFAGTVDRLYKSTDQGASWDTLFIEANDGLEMCPTEPDRMYIAGAAGGKLRLHRSDNLGSTFIRLDTNSGFPPDSNIFITKMSVHPNDADQLWVTLSGFVDGKKVYYTPDAGNTWINKTLSLPNVPFLSIAVQSNGDVFAGCIVGAFYLPNGYTDWIPFNNQLPRTRITDFVINESAGLIRASTYGRGAWETALPDGICDPSLSWVGSPAIEGHHYYEVSGEMTTDFQLFGGVTTEVYLKSNNFIDMKPGFLAPADGSVYRATIGPCATGGLPGSN